MELKCARKTANSFSYQVLIVPLWNWNKNNPYTVVVDKRSNRTFMELKSRVAGVGKQAGFSSNRTFMELKYGHVLIKLTHTKF